MTHPWEAVSGTQIGSVHVRDGKPAQDAHRAWSDRSSAVITVADGHGHHLHFRSDTGADLAAQVALDLLVSSVGDFHEAGPVETRLATELGPALVSGWNRAVLTHVRDHPFTGLEQELVAGDSTEDLLRPYGSTILAMAASQQVVAVMQIGDGDAIVVAGDGISSRPLPVDDDLDGVRTTSLCQPDPLRSLRCAALDVAAEDVMLGYLCTDGFGSPRADAEGWWRQVGEELLQHARHHGLEWIAGKLPLWLDEPAQYGGDDTTLAVIGLPTLEPS
jgi:hypothetical protein